MTRYRIRSHARSRSGLRVGRIRAELQRAERPSPIGRRAHERRTPGRRPPLYDGRNRIHSGAGAMSPADAITMSNVRLTIVQRASRVMTPVPTRLAIQAAAAVRIRASWTPRARGRVGRPIRRARSGALSAPRAPAPAPHIAGRHRQPGPRRRGSPRHARGTRACSRPVAAGIASSCTYPKASPACGSTAARTRRTLMERHSSSCEDLPRRGRDPKSQLARKPHPAAPDGPPPGEHRGRVEPGERAQQHVTRLCTAPCAGEEHQRPPARLRRNRTPL